MNWIKIFSNLLLVAMGLWICFYGATLEKYFITSAVVLLLLISHIIAARNHMIEGCVIIITGIIGAVVESINLSTGVYQYVSVADQSTMLPTWIIMAWFLVGTTIRQLFRKLPDRIETTTVAGAIAGTIIYYFAAKIGAIEFTAGRMPFSVIPVLTWSLAFPVMIYVGNRFFASVDTASTP